jgi:signal transduction histidine kinase
MELVKLPSSWLDMGYSTPAYGTFRLTLKTGEARQLMLHIPEIAEAGTVWLNGKKVYEAGNPGGDGEFVLSVKNAFAALDAENGVTEIVIQAGSGAGLDMIGMTYSLRVGSENPVLHETMLRRVALMGVIGAMFMMAAYHFLLFMGNRKDKIYLWFVLFVLITALRLSMETNGLFQLFASNGINGWLSRVYMASFTAQCLFLILFTFEAFRIDYWPRKRLWRVINGVSGGILAAIILFYLATPEAPLWPTYVSVLLLAFFTAVAARRMFKEKQAGYMGLYLIALFLFLFWGVGSKVFMDNLLYVPGVLSNTFMMLAQTVALSVGYADAKRKSKEATAKVDFYHRLAHDLLTPLTKVSTDIQSANRKEETDHKRLTDSQADIMEMASMINSALRDYDKEDTE